MYKWVKGNSFTRIATFYAGNITLNVPCISLFDGIKWCLIGIDEDNKKVAIKPLKKDEIDKKTIPEDAINKVSIGKSFVRICNKTIITEVSRIIKKKAEGNKFGVEYNSNEKLLEIDLTAII